MLPPPGAIMDLYGSFQRNNNVFFVFERLVKTTHLRKICKGTNTDILFKRLNVGAKVRVRG